MIKIEIGDLLVHRKQIVSKKSGEVFDVFHQVGYLDKGDKYPMKFEVPLDRNKPEPYPIGMYTLAPESLRVTQFGSLELDRFNVHLVPLAPVVVEAFNRSRKAA